MIISKIKIKNFRNIKYIDISLSRFTIFIGENNSGKSNILKALTLPLANDEIGQQSKTLGWQDINNEAKKEYFYFLQEKQAEIKNGTLVLEELKAKIPQVVVELIFHPSESDEYYLRNWGNDIRIDTKEIHYGIAYKYTIENVPALFRHLEKLFNLPNFVFEEAVMNLLR